MSDGKTVDLAAIRARLATATPGPWARGIARDDDGWAVLANVGDGDDEVCTQPPSRASDPYSHTDADLIAHAPADLAALCDEVERLRYELDDARNVALGLTDDCAGLREIIAGRTTPPTDAEIEAHDRSDVMGGRWRVMADGGRYIGMAQNVGQAKTMRDSTTGRRIERWWPVNAAGAPTQWPVVTPARAKPCECSAAHADEYVAVCDESCDCLCHE